MGIRLFLYSADLYHMHKEASKETVAVSGLRYADEEVILTIKTEE
jgi:hypothetical protein